MTYVPPGMIGVRQVSYGPGKGLQKKPVNPGYRREIAGYETIHTFPRDIQVVEFTNNPSESSDKHRQMPAVKVPTVDGYPVDVDVSVLYRLKDPYKVASKFGFGTGYEESVVIRFTDSLIKQYSGRAAGRAVLPRDPARKGARAPGRPHPAPGGQRIGNDRRADPPV